MPANCRSPDALTRDVDDENPLSLNFLAYSYIDKHRGRVVERVELATDPGALASGELEVLPAALDMATNSAVTGR